MHKLRGLFRNGASFHVSTLREHLTCCKHQITIQCPGASSKANLAIQMFQDLKRRFRVAENAPNEKCQPVTLNEEYKKSITLKSSQCSIFSCNLTVCNHVLIYRLLISVKLFYKVLIVIHFKPFNSVCQFSVLYLICQISLLCIHFLSLPRHFLIIFTTILFPLFWIFG